jgi:hypothetical protein
MDNRPWITRLHDEEQNIKSIASELRQLGRAFLLTGNGGMNQKMEGIAEELENSSARISDIAGKKLDDDLKSVQVGLGNIGKTLIEHATKAKKG